jgi:hypothetical protein
VINPGEVGVFIPIVAMGGFFAWMIALSPVGKALAERLLHGSKAAGAPQDTPELMETVEELRREVAELAERVDFTERLLGQQRAEPQLGKPRE